MMPLNLAAADVIIRDSLAHARKAKFRPLTVVVLDQRGVVIAAASEDGTSLRRFEVARGKASSALAFNIGSRKLGEMAVEVPHSSLPRRMRWAGSCRSPAAFSSRTGAAWWSARSAFRRFFRQ